MPSPRPRPRVSVQPTIRPRVRPRASLRSVAVLDQPEEAFRRTVADLEAAPLFERLRSEGLIRKGPLRGWIPAHLYRDYLDSEMLPLIRDLGLSERSDWIDGLASAPPSEAERRAARYGIPAEAAQRLARYARRLSSPDDLAHGPGEGAESRKEASAGVSLQGAEDAQAFLTEFAQRYAVGLEQFRRCVLSDDMPLVEACRALGAPEEAVQAAREAALCVLLLDLASGPRTPTATDVPSQAPEIVAAIVRGPAGLPTLAMDPANEYAQTYYMDRRAVDALYRLADSTAEADGFLRQMRDLNRRKTVLYRILAALVRSQSRYLMSGDDADLAPLSQAELARGIGEHPSTVCRMLRDRWIEVHGQTRPIASLLPSRGSVIAGLIARMPESPDRAIAEELQARFGLNLSRRTVAYHRGKLDK